MTAMTLMEGNIEYEVAALGDLPRDELVARWVKAYGCPPPKGVKRGLLLRAAAWHRQAQLLGGLSSGARKAIRDAAKQHRHATSRKGALREPSDTTCPEHHVPLPRPSFGRHDQTAIPAQALRPGTRLVREWNGRSHVIDVGEEGFVFDGKTYRSLSAIAKRITGAHWSGPRFFGL